MLAFPALNIQIEQYSCDTSIGSFLYDRFYNYNNNIIIEKKTNLVEH